MIPIIIGLILLIGTFIVGNVVLDKKIQKKLSSTTPSPTIKISPSPSPKTTYKPQMEGVNYETPKLTVDPDPIIDCKCGGNFHWSYTKS